MGLITLFCFKFSKDADWELVFKATENMGIDAYDTWMSGTVTSSQGLKHIDMSDSSAAAWYRSSVIDNWSASNINQV